MWLCNTANSSNQYYKAKVDNGGCDEGSLIEVEDLHNASFLVGHPAMSCIRLLVSVKSSSHSARCNNPDELLHMPHTLLYEQGDYRVHEMLRLRILFLHAICLLALLCQ